MVNKYNKLVKYLIVWKVTVQSNSSKDMGSRFGQGASGLLEWGCWPVGV